MEFWHHFEVEASLDYVIRTRADGSWEFFTGRGVENITVTVTEPFQVRFTATRSWLEKDVRVVKGEGDLVTLVVSTNYHITVFQPNGKQDAVNTGRFEGRLVIDTSTGEVISDDFVKSVGHIGAPGSCTSALEFANQ